jgi:hypothetical protein
MNTFEEINYVFDMALSRAMQCLMRLESIIKNMPDNNRIKRLPNACAFTMNFSDLMSSGNWTPEHHDFKVQYEAVVDALKSVDIREVPDKFKSILNDGFVMRRVSGNPISTMGWALPQRGSGGRYKIQLHPDVINNLRSIL